MSDIEIVNPIEVGEAGTWYRQLATTLLGDPHADDWDARVRRWSSDWIPERSWGVRDGERWVATLATKPRVVTVPGADGATVDVLADALTAVTVAATHRRQGILRRMLTESLRRAKDAGEPFSVLIAAEWPIYGRYGYAPAVWFADYTYRPRWRGAAVTPGRAGGRVRQIEPAELAALAPGIFDRVRRRRPGQIDRPGLWWDRRLDQPPFEPVGKKSNWLVHEGPDGPDGILSWKVSRDFDIDAKMGAVEVDELHADGDAAYRNLWAYLSSLDLIEEVRLQNGAVDEAVRWLLPDGRTLVENYRGDFMWVRLLDVPAALSARGYTGEASVVLEVVDELAGGRFRLDTATDGAACAPTSDPADLKLTQQALASIYLGGNSLRAQAIAGGIEELTPGALGRVDALFATAVAPWCATGF